MPRERSRSNSREKVSRTKRTRDHNSSEAEEKRNGHATNGHHTKSRKLPHSFSRSPTPRLLSGPQKRPIFFSNNSNFIIIGDATIEKKHHRSSDVGKNATAEPDVAAGPGDFANFPEIDSNAIAGLKARGIDTLFPVQYMTFNRIYNHEDLIVRDLTGSGKTLGFCLPMLMRLRRERSFGQGKPQAMILAPTRELALQITKELHALKYSENEFNVLTVYGGTNIHEQTHQLRRGVDIFVGTCGRVIDHMHRGNFDFSTLKFAILDEADQMLNLGFKENVEEIMGTIKSAGLSELQCLMFSATIPRWVQNIA